MRQRGKSNDLPMHAATHPPVRPARDLLHDLMELLPAAEVALINPLVYANASLLGHATYRRFLFWINAARDVAQPPVRLGRYAPGTTIDGDGPFHVLTQGTLVAEHVALPPDALAANYEHMMVGRTAACDVAAPCLLACHPGTQVWSHWLIDTLPKILLAERADPQRFIFVVPAEITDPASPRFLVRSILETLAAYGIAPHRLLRLKSGTIYRFANLFDVIGLTADGVHPGVLKELRRIVPEDAAPPAMRMMASMRGGGEIRPIVNLPNVWAVLDAHGATRLDPGSTPFMDKVRAFAASDIIVGDLGSNLATMIYARRGASIVTLAPSNWRDNYFAQMFQRMDVYHADVRGMPLPNPEDVDGHSAHVIYPAHLQAGLEAAQVAPRGSGPLNVDGQAIARAPGPVHLRIDFGRGGNAGDYLRSECAPVERDMRWSLGTCCTLTIPRQQLPRGDFWIEVHAEGMVAPPHLVSRPLALLADGVRVGEWDLEELVHVHAFVPQQARRRSGEMVLEFHHPICPSPASLGKPGGDERPLGFMFAFVAVRSLG